MKLWYQSMSRQTEWGGYPRVLRGILDKVRDPDTEIHVAGITEIGGTGDQFRYLEYLETGEVLKNVHRAVREDFDAFLVGNIADPGLQEAREIADIPVLGLCESALHVACMMGASFSLVTINEKFTDRGERAALWTARSARGGEPHAGGPADRPRYRIRRC
jgi:allantoin racemase